MSGDLTTLANVKDWLEIEADQTDDDATLSRLITAASGWLERWLNRQIRLADYDELRDGTGAATLVLKQYPVVAIASLAIDGRAVPAAGSATAPGYRIVGRRVALNGYAFTRGIGNVAVSYSAGYAEVPPEIEQAAIELVARRYRGRKHTGLVSEAFAQQTTSYSQADMADETQTALEQYRNVVPVS